MFNETWVTLALFAILVGLVVQESGLLVIALLVVMAAAVGWIWNKYSLQGIEYKRAFSERRAFLGETVDVTVQVTNHKWLPLSWLRVDDECPLALTMLEGHVQPSTKPEIGLLSSVMSLRWHDRARWRYRLRCDQRGVYAFGPARLQSGDLFGLFSSQQVESSQDWLIIYPAVKPIADLALPPKEPFGDFKGRQWVFEDPSRPVGIRDYGTRDDLKRIHWKATARQQKLQVKVFEPSTTFQLVIFLDMVTLPKPWYGSIPELVERGISTAASIASFAANERYQVGLLANGCWPQSDQPLKVLPSRDPNQLTRILEALAAVSAVPTGSIEALLNKESTHLPWGATLVVVAAVVTEELIAVMARLQAAGRRIVLVCLDDTPLPVAAPKIMVHRVQDLGEAFGFRTEASG